MKLGILMHPMWDDDENMFKVYSKHIKEKEYDKVIVYMPLINKQLKGILYDIVIFEFIKYYNYNKDWKTFKYNASLEMDNWIAILDYIIEHNPKFKRYMKNSKTDIGRTINERLLRKLYLGKKMREIMTSERSDIVLFSGDKHYHRDTLEIFSRSLKYDLNLDDLVVNEYGGVSNIDVFIDDEYKNIPLDTTVEIFGEYLNQCCAWHKKSLEEVGYTNVTFIPEASIYAIEKGFDNHGEYKHLQGKCYKIKNIEGKRWVI